MTTATTATTTTSMTSSSLSAAVSAAEVAHLAQLAAHAKQVAAEEKSRLDRTRRRAAGKKWTDKSLADWPENDYRIFVGDLGNEINDKSLGDAFRQYASFAMARVVKDKRNDKSRGFGFVSFTSPEDYSHALKNLNGVYIGSRPVKLTKSSWQKRAAHKKKRSRNHLY
jgi:RNA recognition motif-containing protein